MLLKYNMNSIAILLIVVLPLANSSEDVTEERQTTTIRTTSTTKKRTWDEDDIMECDNTFEGFGVHLGSITDISKKNKDTIIPKIVDLLYNDLGLRHFRTSYEPEFSIFKNEYNISCRSAFSCTWNKMHQTLNKYSDIKIFATIWNPPPRMKNWILMLDKGSEWEYYYYIKNITQLIKDTFNQTIELVSMINEPENFIAFKDHTNMGPHQLCRIIQEFNDTLVSACAENSLYGISKLYLRHKKDGIDCQKICKTILTHAYGINLDILNKNFLRLSYDLSGHLPIYDGKPHWVTEVSSTYTDAETNQMLEAAMLAMNIINFLGTTCVSRYYYWLAYTSSPSGQSLIWGNTTSKKFDFPKKYHVYRHFTRAALLNPNQQMRRCDSVYFDLKTGTIPGLCLQFGTGTAPTVFVNHVEGYDMEIGVGCKNFCCTTATSDFECGVPTDDGMRGFAICSCNELIL